MRDRAHPRAGQLLRFDVLEDRLTPTTFRWQPLPAGDEWTTRLNWREQAGAIWIPATRAPSGPEDVAEFWGEYNKNCIVPGNIEVGAIRVRAASPESGPDYTAAITIQSSLTLTGPATSQLYSPATLAGGADAEGRLNIGSGSITSWRAGTLSYLTVNVNQGGQLSVAVPANGPNVVQDRTDITVSGTLNWTSGNVTAIRSAPPLAFIPSVRINAGPTGFATDGGTFNVSAAGGRWGAANPSEFRVVNQSKVNVAVGATATATVAGDYTTTGMTTVSGGTFEIVGLAEQGSNQWVPRWTIQNRSTVKPRGLGNVLGIRAGQLAGDGTVDGNLVLGQDPNAPGFGGQGSPTPSIAPGGGPTGYGKIDVLQNFHMFVGWVEIDVNGAADDQHDRIDVRGYAALADLVEGSFTAQGQAIAAGVKVHFLKATGGFLGNFARHQLPQPWIKDKDATQYWFEKGAVVNGKAARDENGNGVFEPGLGETVLAGVGVTLLDAADNELDQTTTDADGRYEFQAVPFGTYQVRFDQPADLWPSPRHAGSDPAADSDIDLGTLLAAVTLDEYHPVSDPHTDALFRPNRPPLAADDDYPTPFETAVSGNVLDNDFDPDGDTLTVTGHGTPAHGSVTVNPDGSFTYTPYPGFSGYDSFTYTITDGHGGTATATVTISVADPGYGTGGVFGRVWWDANGDGIQDADETGSAGSVTVALIDVNGFFSTGTTVGADGTYSFSGIPPGQYRLQVTSFSFIPTLPKQGSDATRDSDVYADGYSDVFAVVAGRDISLDAGMIYFVWEA